MPFDAPFRLGPFMVDETGGLSPGAPGQFPSFNVCWRDRALHLRLADAPAAGGGQGSLGVQAVLGRVPSTAGDGAANGPAWRERSFALLCQLPPHLPSGWQLGLSADHRIHLTLKIELELPTTAAALTTEVTLLLLELAPYLDVLEEAGISAVPPSFAAGAGMAKT